MTEKLCSAYLQLQPDATKSPCREEAGHEGPHSAWLLYHGTVTWFTPGASGIGR